MRRRGRVNSFGIKSNTHKNATRLTDRHGNNPTSSRNRLVRLLLVDGHEITRVGVRALLGQVKHFEIVGEANTIASALEEASQLRPDVVLVELRLPDGSGIDACRRIRKVSPGTRLLVLTYSANDELVMSALQAEVAGFVDKTISSEDLIKAIETVATGQSLLNPAATHRGTALLHDQPVSTDGKKRGKLSAQQQRIMELVVQGKTNKEVAGILSLSEKTVKNYLSYAFVKLEATRRAHATSIFLQQTRET